LARNRADAPSQCKNPTNRPRCNHHLIHRKAFPLSPYGP
jgi:hypothetical protein